MLGSRPAAAPYHRSAIISPPDARFSVTIDIGLTAPSTEDSIISLPRVWVDNDWFTRSASYLSDQARYEHWRCAVYADSANIFNPYHFDKGRPITDMLSILAAETEPAGALLGFAKQFSEDTCFSQRWNRLAGHNIRGASRQNLPALLVKLSQPIFIEVVVV